MESASNLHPMFVHFPIVFILTALLMDLLKFVLKNDQYGKFAGLLLNLAAVSAVIALYFGYQAADILGHDSPGHDQVHAHRDVMLWITWLTVGAAILFQFLKTGKAAIFRLLTLIILSAILVVGTDKGAQLVYKYGMGVNPEVVMNMHEEGGHSHDGGSDHHESESTEPKKKVHVHSDGSSHEH